MTAGEVIEMAAKTAVKTTNDLSVNASEILTKAFKEVGLEFGFEKVEAEYSAFKEFKVRWQRSYKWADFKVSDYLEDAPEEIVRDLAKTLFGKITGDDAEGYPQAMCDHITSPEFVKRNQPVYLKRCRNITKSSKSEDGRDLKDSANRLIEMGLITKKDIKNVQFRWTKESNIRKIGNCSVLMKVVTISSILDTDMIPEFVLDYCLYHEMCHLIIGFDPTAKAHGEKFSVLEDKYPKKAESVEWLKRLCLYL